MKRNLIFLLAFFSVGLAFANPSLPPNMPNVNQTVSESVYYSSVTLVATVDSGTRTIAFTPSYLFTIVVGSAGAPGAKVELFDSKLTTSGVPRLLPPLDTDNVVPYFTPQTYNIYAATGITLNNSGNPPAQVGVIFRPR